jgi:hypothetical protein
MASTAIKWKTLAKNSDATPGTFYLSARCSAPSAQWNAAHGAALTVEAAKAITAKLRR